MNNEQVRVLRGGSWYNASVYLRAAYRLNLTLSNDYSYVGFRCALSY